MLSSSNTLITTQETMRFISLIVCLYFPLTLWGNEILPAGCMPIVISELIHLPPGKPRLILLHNLSETTLWLIPRANTTKANLSSALAPQQWSSLHLDQHALTIGCIESKPGHEQEIACHDRVAVCEWIPNRHPKKPSGIVWAAENMTLTPLIAYLGRHGFIVPSSSEKVID